MDVWATRPTIDMATRERVPVLVVANRVPPRGRLPDEMRAELEKLATAAGEEFEAFVKDNSFDLHYQALPLASPMNLGLGHLWKLAVDHPTSRTLPCIHRAPIETDGKYRLLLIC
jgi:hypothetical protein